MRFSVEYPDFHDSIVRAAEDGPGEVCWQGDEMCSFFKSGPCTMFRCTCETTGSCRSCPPPGWRRSRRVT